MEPINALKRSYMLMMLLIITTVSVFSPVPSIEIIIGEVFSKYKFKKKSGWLLQFWACSSSTSPNSEYIHILTLKNQPFESTGGQELNNYRRRCLDKDNCFVGHQTKVGNWFAGRAAQTKIADHRTEEFVLCQDPHNAEAPGNGELVFPVFSGEGLVGIIELVTIVPKQSYTKDFEELCQLLEGFGLRSKYMGKTIKVKYEDHLIRFTLPYSATVTDLHWEVTHRFKELKQRTFCVNYEDSEDNLYPIQSNVDLQRVMAEPCPVEEDFIRMRIP